MDYIKDFEKKVQEKTDDELMAMLDVPEEYIPEAQEAIKNEILRRGKLADYVLRLSDEQLVNIVSTPGKDELPELIDTTNKEIARRGGKDTLLKHFMETKSVEGKFRKVMLSPATRNGQYRGRGSLQVKPEGVQINGSHVLSLGARWGIGLSIFFGSIIFSLAITGGFAYCAPGFIPLYFLMEYGILRREKIFVPYSDITHVSVDPQSSLIGIQFKGKPQCSPVAMQTSEWKAVSIALKQKIPAIEATQVQVKRRSSLVVIVAVVIICFIFIIGIIAAIAIPNLLIANQKAKQLTAMKDMMNISAALSNYFVDNVEFPKQEGTYDVNSDIYNAINPIYLQVLPINDPWGNKYRIYCGKAVNERYGISGTEDDFLVISYGKDGQMESWLFDEASHEADLFPIHSIIDFDNDLVLLNGAWVRGPSNIFNEN